MIAGCGRALPRSSRICFELRPTRGATSVAKARSSARCVSNVARQQGHHRCAAVAHQRQRHADHREQAADHAGVDEDVHEEGEREARGEQARERVLHLRREVHGAADDEQVQQHQHDQPEQAELLADHREDEVGVALGQVVELRLRTLHPALAEHAARADGDLRLDDVVARAERIVLRVEEGEHALALVVVQQWPADPGRAAREQRRATHEPGRQTRHHDHEPAADGDEHGGAQVRLRGGEARGHGDDEGEHREAGEAGRQWPLMQIPRAQHRHGELHDLGGLEADEAQVEPALRALADVAGDVDDEQQHDAEHVDRQRGASQDVRVDLGQ
jgi:hypothetical protein